MLDDLLKTHFHLYDYRYDEATVLLETASLKKPFVDQADFEHFVDAVLHERNIVFYVPARNQALAESLLGKNFREQGEMRRLVFRLGDAEMADMLRRRMQKWNIETYFSSYQYAVTRPCDEPKLQKIVEKYLGAHEQRFLDLFGRREKILADRAGYHWYLDRRGEPMAFQKGISYPGGREAEILYGCGSARQNIVSIVNSLLEEIKLGTQNLEMLIPYDDVVGLVTKLGALPVERLRIFTAARR